MMNVILLLLCCCLTSSLCDEVRVSDVSVLLPLTNEEVYYDITGFNGCFKWTVMGKRCVSLEHLDGDERCYSKIRIRGQFGGGLALQQELVDQRQSTWIQVEELETKKTFRCDIFFDKVEKIQISTTNRKLFKDELERIDVRGYDSSGNMFSTLEGLPFHWTLLPSSSPPHSPSAPLATTTTPSAVIVTFTDARVYASNLILSMEKRHRYTSAVLVKGIDIGTVTLHVQLVVGGGTPSSQLPQTSVLMSVHERLVLEPPGPLYVAPGGEVRFSLMISGKNVVLPNPLYKWSVDHPTVATLDESGLLYTHSLGSASLLVAPVHMKEDNVTCPIFVVDPSMVKVELIKDGDEVLERPDITLHEGHLVVNKHYEMRAALFYGGPTSDAYKMHLTENLSFDVSVVPSDSVTLEYTSRNKATFALTTRKHLPSITLLISHNKLTSQQTATIVSAVTLPLLTVVLPYDPVLVHRFVLIPQGGSGAYRCTSRDDTRVPIVGGITNSNVLRGERVGRTTVKCHDQYDPYNVDQIEVTVVPPSSIVFLPTRVEVAVGDELDLFAALTASADNRILFDNCTVLAFQWELLDPLLFEVVPSPPHVLPSMPHACTTRRLRAVNVGTTNVRVHYEGIFAQVIVAVYRPFTISQDSVVLTLGSSYRVGVLGGPLPWAIDGGEYALELLPQKDASAVSIWSHSGSTSSRANAKTTSGVGVVSSSSSSSTWQVFTLRCLKHGEQYILVRAGNKPTETNPVPVVVEAKLFFSCSKPVSTFIYPITGGDGANKVQDTICAEAMETILNTRRTTIVDRLLTEYRIRNGRVVDFNLQLFDENNRAFHNFSSINVEWSSSNPDVILVEPLSTPRPPTYDSSELSVYKQTRSFTLSNKEVSASVTVSLRNYDSSSMGGGVVVARDSSVSYQTSFTFALYRKVELDPQQESLYLHSQNHVTLRTVGGSGHYYTEVNGTATVELLRAEPTTTKTTTTTMTTHDLIVKPLSEGVATVDVIDVCLPTDRSRSIVSVSDVVHIKMACVDMVQVGKSVVMHILAVDANGIPFPMEQLRLIRFEVQLDNKMVLSIVPDQARPSSMRISGLATGTATVTLSTKTMKGSIIVSDPKLIHVFPPLVLEPLKLVLLPGTMYQLQWKGGPPASEEVLFRLTNPDDTEPTEVATIDSQSGLIMAHKVGTARILATIYRYHHASDSRTELGTSTAELTVKHLEKLRIVSTGTNRLFVGESLCLTAAGSNGESPFAFESLDVAFRWDVAGNTKAVQLNPFYSNNNDNNDNSFFGTCVTAKSEGQCSVTTTVVRSPKETQLLGMEATFLFTVVKPLQLLSPALLLLAPGSSYHIRTSYDGDPAVKQLHYEVLRVDAGAGAGAEAGIEVSPNGVVKAHKNAGSFYVIITDSEKGKSSTSQSLMVKVVVKPITGLYLLSSSSSTSSSTSWGLAVGSTLYLNIFAQDENGVAFHSYDGVNIESRLNKPNVASLKLEMPPETPEVVKREEGGAGAGEVGVGVGESSVRRLAQLVVHALSPGTAVLKISSVSATLSPTQREKTDLSFYFPIFVQNAITPVNAVVHPGSTIHFRKGFMSDAFYKNPWSCNNSILSIDSHTGVAVADGGMGVVVVSYSGGVSTHTTLTVSPASLLQLEEPMFKYDTSNQFVLRVPVQILTGSHAPLTHHPDINSNLLLSCELTNMDETMMRELRTQPISVENGTEGVERACLVYYSHDVSGLMELKYRPKLKATVIDKEGMLSLSDTREVYFTPLFNVQPREIKLSGSEVQVTVVWLRREVGGENPNLEVEANTVLLDVHKVLPGDRLWIGHISKVNSSTDFYSISVKPQIRTSFKHESVTFYYPNTGQKIPVIVSYNADGGGVGVGGGSGGGLGGPGGGASTGPSLMTLDKGASTTLNIVLIGLLTYGIVTMTKFCKSIMQPLPVFAGGGVVVGVAQDSTIVRALSAIAFALVVLMIEQWLT